MSPHLSLVAPGAGQIWHAVHPALLSPHSVKTALVAAIAELCIAVPPPVSFVIITSSSSSSLSSSWHWPEDGGLGLCVLRLRPLSPVSAVCQTQGQVTWHVTQAREILTTWTLSYNKTKYFRLRLSDEAWEQWKWWESLKIWAGMMKKIESF